VTAYRIELSLPVEARGLLRLDPPAGRPLELLAQGATLVLRVPGREELRELVAPLGGAGRWRPVVRLAGRTLCGAGLALRLELAGETVLSLGAEIRPSWLARVLRLGPVRTPWTALPTLWSLRRALSKQTAS
jgi:hypothetical protein